MGRELDSRDFALMRADRSRVSRLSEAAD